MNTEDITICPLCTKPLKIKNAKIVYMCKEHVETFPERLVIAVVISTEDIQKNLTIEKLNAMLETKFSLAKLSVIDKIDELNLLKK